jgi:predicted transcriptional regulator
MLYGMPPAIKSTFSLDRATIERIDSLAERWHVSKTEVLRRAVRNADEHVALDAEERLEAMRKLQESLAQRKVNFAKWKKTIRDGRR